jgi:hypothetical protein
MSWVCVEPSQKDELNWVDRWYDPTRCLFSKCSSIQKDWYMSCYGLVM